MHPPEPVTKGQSPGWNVKLTLLSCTRRAQGLPEDPAKLSIPWRSPCPQPPHLQGTTEGTSQGPAEARAQGRGVSRPFSERDKQTGLEFDFCALSM